MDTHCAERATLFFDGACPFCAREIAVHRQSPGADQLGWVDVSVCAAAELGPGLRREAALSRLHIRLPDDRPFSGAAAFTALWMRLPRWAWLGRLLAPAPAQALLEWICRLFLHLRRPWRRPSQ